MAKSRPHAPKAKCWRRSRGAAGQATPMGTALPQPVSPALPAAPDRTGGTTETPESASPSTSQQPACEPAADPSPEAVPSRASLPVLAVLPVGTRQTLRPGEPRMAGAPCGSGRCGCKERSEIRRPRRAPPRQCSSSSAEHRAGAWMAPMHVTAHPVPRQAVARPRRGGTPRVPPLSRKPEFRAR